MIAHPRLARLVILAACLVLAACGFQPLYATRGGGPATTQAELASVTVAEQSSRLGQLVRNEILSTIAPVGQEAETRYVLELLPRAAEEVTIRAFDTGVLRRAIRVEVAFRLRRVGSGEELYAGRTFSQASYDRTDTPFADMQARITAEERAAKEVGTDIATRLAAFFAGS